MTVDIMWLSTDVGLRLTFTDTIPYRAHFEIHLTENDIQNIITALQSELQARKRRGETEK